jgi:uncharacterized RDD family membrane protein YckC
MQCSNCQRENAPAYRFCIFCGSPLKACEVEEPPEVEQTQAVADTGPDRTDEGRFNVGANQMETGMNYARFQRRFVAWIIDAVILVALFWIIVLIVDAVLSTPGGGYVDAQVGAFWVYVTWVPLSSLYIIGFWTWRGQTPGKMVMRIKIVRSDGSPIGLGRAIRRYIGYGVLIIIVFILFIPLFFALRSIPGHWVVASLVQTLVVLILCWLHISLNRKKQGLHDKIAKTYVVVKVTGQNHLIS